MAQDGRLEWGLGRGVGGQLNISIVDKARLKDQLPLLFA